MSGTPIIVNIIIIMMMITYDPKVCRCGHFDGWSHAERTKRLYNVYKIPILILYIIVIIIM